MLCEVQYFLVTSEAHICWSLSLNSCSVLRLKPLLSSLCSALPISFLPQRDTNTGLAEGLRVIMGDTNAVQSRNQLKIDYLKCSWLLRIFYWLYFLLRLMHHRTCLLLSMLQFLSSVFKVSSPCCLLHSLELPANKFQIHVLFLLRQFIFCFPLSFQAWPRDEFCHSGRRARLAAISVCFKKSCFSIVSTVTQSIICAQDSALDVVSTRYMSVVLIIRSIVPASVQCWSPQPNSGYCFFFFFMAWGNALLGHLGGSNVLLHAEPPLSFMHVFISSCDFGIPSELYCLLSTMGMSSHRGSWREQ